jgi:hypothetical protein
MGHILRAFEEAIDEPRALVRPRILEKAMKFFRSRQHTDRVQIDAAYEFPVRTERRRGDVHSPQLG